MQLSDASLVSECLTGNRDAFGQIVARYQSLICALAYSNTGSLSQSEDIAQETFVAAWKQLDHLREPNKLRAWLCQIARNRTYDSLKKQGREPSHAAELLENATETIAPEPLPLDQTISNEEQAILWRSLERIPEIYREPLVLFYREHQSIESVAKNLELTEDTVKQRLSRGRKLLHEQVLAFVEGALERTNPGKVFTLAVVAALPTMTFSAKAATLGVAAAKGSASAKAATAAGVIGMTLSPLLILFGNYAAYRMQLDTARDENERGHIRKFYRLMLCCALGLAGPVLLLAIFAERLNRYNPLLVTVSVIALAATFLIVITGAMIFSLHRRRRLMAELKFTGVLMEAYKPAWEYRSAQTLFGWPLIHFRLERGMAKDKSTGPVKAWIAAGDSAVGLLFAFGGWAAAPISFGGLAIGLLPFGGTSVGVLALGGMSIGVWSWGGLALGWQTFGGVSLAWNAAVGGIAVAHDYALGGLAQAAQANSKMAASYIQSTVFFSHCMAAAKYFAWLNLLWVVPMFICWRLALKAKRIKNS